MNWRMASALVAVWALFGIKFISGHPKHVVALHTDAMDVDRGGLGRPGKLLRVVARSYRLIAHGSPILARREMRGALPGEGKVEDGGKNVEKWSNLLIDFKLAANRPVKLL
jgi:hypothetical protein